MQGMRWPNFHELWGKSKDRVYDKQAWMDLQRQLETLEADTKELVRTVDAARELEKKVLALKRHFPA